MDFYTANGWKQGKGKPIVDWRAALRTWERRKKPEQQNDKRWVYDPGDSEGRSL